MNWQAEFDALLETVVRLCEESRTMPTDQQALWLRDRLFASCDPLFIVTQRLKEAKATGGPGKVAKHVHSLTGEVEFRCSCGVTVRERLAVGVDGALYIELTEQSAPTHHP
jgi:hypothetical protein